MQKSRHRHISTHLSPSCLKFFGVARGCVAVRADVLQVYLRRSSPAFLRRSPSGRYPARIPLPGRLDAAQLHRRSAGMARVGPGDWSRTPRMARAGPWRPTARVWKHPTPLPPRLAASRLRNRQGLEAQKGEHVPGHGQARYDPSPVKGFNTVRKTKH